MADALDAPCASRCLPVRYTSVTTVTATASRAGASCARLAAAPSAARTGKKTTNMGGVGGVGGAGVGEGEGNLGGVRVGWFGASVCGGLGAGAGGVW